MFSFDSYWGEFISFCDGKCKILPWKRASSLPNTVFQQPSFYQQAAEALYGRMLLMLPEDCHPLRKIWSVQTECSKGLLMPDVFPAIHNKQK